MTALPPQAAAAARPDGGLPFELPYLVAAFDGDRQIDTVPLETVAATDERAYVLTGRGRLFAAHARWSQRPGTVERWDVELEVRLDDADAVAAGLVVAVRLGATADPHWLIPGLFYGENRPAASRARYPRFAAPAADDPFASREWGFRVDRAASPVVFARDDVAGVALATTELGPLGPNGVGFGLVSAGNAARGATAVPELRLTFPYREEPVAYDGSPTPRPPDLPRHRWRPGESVRLLFRAYRSRPLPYSWVPILDAVHAELAATSPLRPWLPPAATADLAAEGLLRWHLRPDPPVIIETAAFAPAADGEGPPRGDRLAMHVGWLSGTPPAAALLAHGRRTGDPAALAAGAAVLDHIAANLAPCGTFWGQWTAEAGWTKGWTPGEARLHARTLGEATLFMLRAIAIAEAADAAPGPFGPVRTESWRTAAQSNLAYVVAHQRPDGAIPAAWHARTGGVEAWDGCAGLAWVTALVEGARLLGREDLLEPARRAGAWYARFVEDELLFGAPEDVDLGPTSEDGYVAVMAYVALAEASPAGPQRDRWLSLATLAAAWMLSFRYCWNVAFDRESTLGRLDFRTRGLDQASPANQHVHTYGLVALGETVRLARLTGDERLLERSRELFAGARQLIARFDGDFGARRGMVPERAFQTVCFGAKGEIDPLSHAWCLGQLLWACELADGLPELDAAAAGVADAGAATRAAAGAGT